MNIEDIDLTIARSYAPDIPDFQPGTDALKFVAKVRWQLAKALFAMWPNDDPVELARELAFWDLTNTQTDQEVPLDRSEISSFHVFHTVWTIDPEVRKNVLGPESKGWLDATESELLSALITLKHLGPTTNEPLDLALLAKLSEVHSNVDERIKNIHELSITNDPDDSCVPNGFSARLDLYLAWFDEGATPTQAAKDLMTSDLTDLRNYLAAEIIPATFNAESFWADVERRGQDPDPLGL